MSKSVQIQRAQWNELCQKYGEPDVKRYADALHLLPFIGVIRDGGCIPLAALDPHINDADYHIRKEKELERKLVDEMQVNCITQSGIVTAGDPMLRHW